MFLKISLTTENKPWSHGSSYFAFKRCVELDA